jgi:hypothetical protein
VPLGVALCRLELSDHGAVLVTGRVAEAGDGDGLRRVFPAYAPPA